VGHEIEKDLSRAQPGGARHSVYAAHATRVCKISLASPSRPTVIKSFLFPMPPAQDKILLARPKLEWATLWLSGVGDQTPPLCQPEYLSNGLTNK